MGNLKRQRVVVFAAWSALAVFLLAWAWATPTSAQEVSSKPVVIPPLAHDVSLPLRDIVASAPVEAPAAQRIIPLRRTPPLPGGGAAPGEDPILQRQSLPLVGTTNGLNFAGISADGVAPPDTNGSVGNTQYVQIVNVEYAVYDKATGTLLLGPTRIHNIWSGFSGDCASGDGGDPNALFDKAAERWIVGQINVNDDAYCIAVSTTSDATGSYYRYEYSFGSNLPDYPKLGVWPDAYYFAANLFFGGAFFTGADPCAFDRATMLNGGPANTICIPQNSGVASLLPSDLDGSTAPPSGEPNLYLELFDSTHLGLFKFHVDFSTPSNSTFTGPTTITVASYNQACGGGTCIPQSGTTQRLDSLGDRLMFRNAYRNLNGTEYLVVNHSVTAGSGVGVRWYQVQDPNGTPSVAQQGTFAPDSTYRWIGSIAMDQAGDIAVGYSASSSSIHPAIRYAGRVPSDPSGSLESENSIIEGTGSQTGSLSRWGDYSGISIDPTDDCTFFYTNEYIPSNGSFNWNTQIASFKFNGCGGPPPPPPPPPSAPFNLTASALNTYQIQLNWQEASGQNQSGFNVYRCQGAGCTNFGKIASVGGSVLTYTDGSSSNPLTESTTYTYQVTAFNAGGESGPSNTASATTQTEPAPTNLTSTAGITGKGSHKRDFVKLSWTNNSTDDDSYHIERCTGSTCTNFTEIATTGANATTYTDNTVARLTTYSYRVRAHSPGGFSGYSNVTTVTTQ
jgi:Fibronectin type III domain